MCEISVIIPVYNLKERLESALASVVGQDFSDFEIVLVDDASSDGSADIAAGILEASGRSYKIIRHERNIGVSAARNNGLRASSGKSVVFVDGDDMLEKNFLSALHDALGSQNDYAACGYKTLEHSSGAFANHFLDVPANLSSGDILAGRILNKIEISHCTALFRRDFLIENNLLYTEGCIAAEDVEFLTKMLCHNPRGAFVRDCLYIYVQHDGMSSRKGVAVREGKLLRYEHHTEAHFREAEYVAAHTEDKKLRVLADNMLLPLGWLRRLSILAMKKDMAAFRELISSREVREILLSSRRSFIYKPEVFARAFAALLFPSLYYKKYSRYLDAYEK